MNSFDTVAIVLAIIYFSDRIWRMIAIWMFFRDIPPLEPVKWPSISLIQPVTSSPNNLRAVLTLRAQIEYPIPIEQVIVLDKQDTQSQLLCQELMKSYPRWKPKLVITDAINGIAMKTVKQLAGLDVATCEVLCFVDDDILLRPDTLKMLVRYLNQDGVGATFGLACYTNWHSTWGALMSGFVNANAIPNYIPLTYLTETYTITGHLYALKRKDFQTMGGLTGMESRIDDDNELARRVMKAGLRNLQTPVIYDVDNELPTLRAFINQMKRWFIFPREHMLPEMSISQRIITLVASTANLLPGMVLISAFWGGVAAWLALIACLLIFYVFYVWTGHQYVKSSTPILGWLLLPVIVLVLPFQIVLVLFSNKTVIWRGQFLHLKGGGEYDVVKRA